MSLGPAGEIVRLAANRQARRAPDYRCVSKAATIATPMPSWCTAALGQQQPRGRGRRCLRTQARTQVSVPRVSRVSKHASTPSELAATMSADPLGHRAAETEPVEGPAPVSATLERADAHERLGGVRFSIGCGPVRLSNGSTVEVSAFADRLPSESSPASGPPPTGSVQFVVDGTNVGDPVPIGGGVGAMSEAVSESVTDLSVGSHTVTARYLADGDFGDSDGTLPGGETVNPAPQTVAFTSTPPTPAAVGGTSTPTATGGVSGNPIVFSIDSTSAPSTCTIAGSTVSFTGVGTCVIDANQAGNADYAAAGQAQQSVSIGQGSQSIAFTSSAPTEAVVAGPTYTPTATGGGSGNPITFRIDNSPQAVCSISPESVVSFIAAGTCTIDANQAGNANYLPATEVQQSFAVSATAGSPPAITSATSTTFASGSIGSFTITASGSPAPALSESGTLPAGVTFLDNGNGTGTLAGTPSGTSGGSYPITITASNTLGSTTQAFTLTIDSSPAITSANSTSFTVGQPASFTLTTDGYPAPSLTESGELPAGVTFTDNGDGTATIVGTITAASVGTFSVKITATNSSGSVVQSLTLTVISGNLMITSAASTILTAGVAGTFTVTATGTPTPTITRQGALPAGITFSAPTAGAATMSGTPAAHDSGLYTINLLATSSSGKTSQTFTFSIDQPPTITSAHSATETAGTPFSFAVTTRGYPTAIMSQTGTLPAGVTFKSNGNGTATIGGTAASGSSSLMLQAATAVGIATQAFTLAVKPAASSPPTVPAFTSPALATTTAGSPFNFQVTTASSSATKLTRSGALPSGLTFTNNGNGTATINGTPTSAGQFTITITAKNSADATTQSFVLTVNQTPSVTSAATAIATVGSQFSFAVATSGYPLPGLTQAGGLPGGLSFTDNGNGTGSIAGTPDAGTGGLYTITITATNPLGTSSQTLALTVRQPRPSPVRQPPKPPTGRRSASNSPRPATPHRPSRTPEACPD